MAAKESSAAKTVDVRRTYTCTHCYRYIGKNLRFHECPGNPGVQGMMAVQRDQTALLLNHLFVNPRPIYEHGSFTPNEVLDLLRTLGHQIVPDKFMYIFPDSLNIPVRKIGGPSSTVTSSMDPEISSRSQISVTQPSSMDQDITSESHMSVTQPSVVTSPTGPEVSSGSHMSVTQPSAVESPISSGVSSRSSPVSGPSQTLGPELNAASDSDSSEPISSSAAKRPRKTPIKTKRVYKANSKRKGLSDAGLYDAPKSYEKLPVMKGYYNYWVNERKKGKELARYHLLNMVKMMFKVNGKSVEFETKNITRDAIRTFYDLLKSLNVAAQTISNYNKSFKHFLSYILYHTDLMQKEKSEYDRLFVLNKWATSQTTAYEGLAKKANRKRKATLAAPPTPYEVTSIVRFYRDDAMKKLTRASKTKLRLKDVTFMNRYLCAAVCLTTGQRTGVLKSLLAADFANAKAIKNTKYMKIAVSEQYPAHIVLNEDMYRMFFDYDRYVRKPIVRRTTEQCPQFFVMWNGQHHQKVSDGITKLQRQAGLSEHSATTARRALETYNERFSDDTQKNMNLLTVSKDKRCSRVGDAALADAINHCDQLCNTPYTDGPPITPAAERAAASATAAPPQLAPLETWSEENPSSEAPKSPDGGTVVVTTKYSRRTRKDIFNKIKSAVTKSPWRDRAQIVANSIINDIGDVTPDTVFPVKQEIQNKYLLSPGTARKVSDKLRYKKSVAVHHRVAVRIIESAAKLQKVSTWDLDEVPEIPEMATLLRFSDGKYIRESLLNKQLIEVLADLKAKHPIQLD